MKIYHNPRCRKSRETVELIKEKGIEPEIILYLESPPSKKDISDILSKLNLPVEAIIRKSEAIYKELFKGKVMSEDEWIEALTKYPKLIERPIVINGDKAIIGRPPENVNRLID